MIPSKSKYSIHISSYKNLVKPNILMLFMTSVFMWSIQLFVRQIAPYTVNHISYFPSPNAPLKIHHKVSHVHFKEENVGWIKYAMNE